MGVTVATDRVACDTSSGNQAITVSAGGLTPKAALFILVGATVDGTAADDRIISYGAATGTSNRWAIQGYCLHGQGTSAVDSGFANDACIQIYDTSSTLVCEADFVSFGVNTVTINWATAPASAWLLTVVSFSGTDLSAYAGIQDVANTQDNTIDITDPGFEPNVLFTALNASLPSSGRTNQFQLSFGVVHNDGASTITQYASYWADRDGRATTDQAMYTSDSAAAIEASPVSGALDFYIDCHTFDSSGFSISARNAGGNGRDLLYLALSFGGAVDSWVGLYSTPTSTGSDSNTGPGFTPQYLHMINTYAEAVDTAYDTPFAGSSGFSAIDANSQFSSSFNGEKGVATSNEQSLSDNVAVELPDDDGSAGLTASFTSFDANGWTLNYSAVEANAKLFFALAIEGEAAAPARRIFITAS